MHHAETMNPCVCSSAIKTGLSTGTRAIRSKQPTEAAVPACSNRGPRQSRALAGNTLGGALTQRRSMKLSAVRPWTLLARGAERDTGAEATALSAMVRWFPNYTVAAAASAWPRPGDFFGVCRMTTKNGRVPSGRDRLTT